MSCGLLKYPRTPHLRGSKLQPGDDDLEQVALSHLRGRHVVIEEKVDGANCAISFNQDRELKLQSRGHYLEGGSREEQFGLLKTWASCLAPDLWARLGERFVVYGEWLFAKHTVYYDSLPHYFLEFDIYDRQESLFLSTARRLELLDGLPVCSVPILHEGDGKALAKPADWIRPSMFKSPGWKDSLQRQALAHGQNPLQVWRETDASEMCEGLYVKIEENGQVLERFKWVRHDFLQAISASASHWRDRPVLPNSLAPGVDLFGASR